MRLGVRGAISAIFLTLLTSLASAAAYYVPTASVSAMQGYGTLSPTIAHAYVGNVGSYDWVAGSCTPSAPTSYAATGVSPSVGCWINVGFAGSSPTPVSSVSNSDGSLTVSPTTGNVVVGLADITADSLLGNASRSIALPAAISLASLGGTNSCAGASNALTYNSSTHAFGCNTISGGSGTVTSVGVSPPSSIITASGSPVTSSGTITESLATQTAHYAWLGPTSGSAAAPTFRAIASADLPVGSASQLGAVQVDNTTITASGGVITATGFAPSTIPFHPGMRSGEFYGMPGSGSGTMNISTGTLYATPFFVPFSTAFTKMQFQVTTASPSGNYELGVYSNSGGLPGSLVYDFGSHAVSTALNTLTGLSGTLSAGWYWLVVSNSSGTIAVDSIAVSGWGAWFLGQSNPATTAANAITASWVYSGGSLPGTFPTVVAIGGTTPNLQLGL